MTLTSINVVQGICNTIKCLKEIVVVYFLYSQGDNVFINEIIEILQAHRAIIIGNSEKQIVTSFQLKNLVLICWLYSLH